MKMPDFDELFSTTQERPVKYKDKCLTRIDYIPFKDGDQFLVKIEKTNSDWIQGIGLLVFGFIEIEALGEKVKDRTFFMENTAPTEISIKVWQDTTKRKQPKSLPRKGLLGVKNIWNAGSGTISSWIGGAAMIVQEIPNGHRYYCNDGHPDENFDDIVFTVQKIETS